MLYWLPNNAGPVACQNLSVASDDNCVEPYYDTLGWMENFRPQKAVAAQRLIFFLNHKEK